MSLTYKNGHAYLRRSVRRGGRVTSEYRASGESAELMALLDSADRDSREAERHDRRAEDRRLDEAEAPLLMLCEWAERLARAALYAAGYHRHNRQWRKRRIMAKKKVTAKAQAPSKAEEIAALLKRAQDGDESAMPGLRELVDRQPTLFGDQGDMAHQAELSLLGAFCRVNLLAKELMSRTLARIASDLAGPAPSPIERLLARRAALCWFTVHQYEATYAQTSGELSIAQADSQQKRIQKAHYRLMSALRTLALVRSVPLTAVQVNVGSVNVGAPADLPPDEPGLMDLLASRSAAAN